MAERLHQIFFLFLKLGMTSFGGPVAHLGYLHEEFVVRRRWLDDAAFGDLVSLCQFLPGPASSQTVFALGMRRAGWPGAVLASLGFLLPSAVLMIALGYGLAALGTLSGAGWLHGLKLAAVAVVAHAVLGMGRSLCPDRARIGIALGAAALLWFRPGALTQMGVIAAGAVLGWMLYRRETPPAASGHSESPEGNRRVAAALLGLSALLLVSLPALARLSGNAGVEMFDGFYRAGSLVFGGGHVVLPLLRAEVAGRIPDDTFLAGYGAAQAMPGPMFSFAGYLGTVLWQGPASWIGGLTGLLGIFLPGWLLIAGALPFWQALRTRSWARAGMYGANAAVVGVLLAALYDPVWTSAVHGLRDAVTAGIAFAMLRWLRLPSWAVVLAAAVMGSVIR